MNTYYSGVNKEASYVRIKSYSKTVSHDLFCMDVNRASVVRVGVGVCFIYTLSIFYTFQIKGKICGMPRDVMGLFIDG